MGEDQLKRFRDKSHDSLVSLGEGCRDARDIFKAALAEVRPDD